MTNEQRQSLRDTALWTRIVLVGLTGALPLFAVSLILIHVAYSDAIDFGLQEQRGNAFERPLERLFEVLPMHQVASKHKLDGVAGAEAELRQSKQRID